MQAARHRGGIGGFRQLAHAVGDRQPPADMFGAELCRHRNKVVDRGQVALCYRRADHGIGQRQPKHTDLKFRFGRSDRAANLPHHVDPDDDANSHLDDRRAA